MTKEITKGKKGFTIIEVVLVLAIAGLIFLMVFVALPALQRSQRDTQRRQDYADLASAISNYTTNNNGKLPSPSSGKLDPKQYINSEGTDPKGTTYTIIVQKGSVTTAPTEGQVYVATEAECKMDDTSGYAQPSAVTNKRAFAVYGYLETGTYCQANQ